MVEEVVKQGGEATAPSGVDEQSPGSGVEGLSPSPETSEVSESQSEGQEKLADGTDLNKPISYKDARRMADTAAQKAVREYQEQQERLAAEENEDTGYERPENVEPPAGGEDPLMTKFLAKYPNATAEEKQAFREYYQHPYNQVMVDELNAVRRDNLIVKHVTGETQRQQFYKDHPDLKPGSKEAKQVEALIIERGYDSGDAYRLVMETKDRIKAEIEVENKKLNEDKRLLNTMPGIKGTANSGRPPMPRTEAEWETYNAWISKQSKR